MGSVYVYIRVHLRLPPQENITKTRHILEKHCKTNSSAYYRLFMKGGRSFADIGSVGQHTVTVYIHTHREYRDGWSGPRTLHMSSLLQQDLRIHGIFGSVMSQL